MSYPVSLAGPVCGQQVIVWRFPSLRPDARALVIASRALVIASRAPDTNAKRILKPHKVQEKVY